MAYTVDYYVNVAGVNDDIVPHDMHCPNIGTKGNNFWKIKCRERQINPIHRRTCYPHCKCNGKQEKTVQVKSGTTEAYVPQTTRKGTIREKIVKLAKHNLMPHEIAHILEMDSRKVRDHLNKARRFNEL